MEKFEPKNCCQVFGEGEVLDALPLAMAYVPMQRWEQLYEPAVALDRGTLFCKLDLPFKGKGAVEDGK